MVQWLNVAVMRDAPRQAKKGGVCVTHGAVVKQSEATRDVPIKPKKGGVCNTCAMELLVEEFVSHPIRWQLRRIWGQLHTIVHPLPQLLLDTITMAHHHILFGIVSISTFNNIPLITACTKFHPIICNIINHCIKFFTGGLLTLWFHLLLTWTGHMQQWEVKRSVHNVPIWPVE